MKNIQLVSEHLEEKKYPKSILKIRKTLDGNVLLQTSENEFWRVFDFIKDYSKPVVSFTKDILGSGSKSNIQIQIRIALIIPIANMASFFTRTPFINPQDQKNLNNAFPGKKDGSITEQIAFFITTNIIAVSDVFLDAHGGDAPEDLLPFVCYYDNQKKPEQAPVSSF